MRRRKEYPHTPHLLLALRKKSPTVKQWRLDRTKTPRQETWPWSRIRLRSHSGQLSLLPHVCYHKRSLSTKIKTDWPNWRSDKQMKSMKEPYISFLTIELCREKWCFATSSSRSLMFYARQPFFAIASLTLSFLQRTKKEVNMATQQSKEIKIFQRL